METIDAIVLLNPSLPGRAFHIAEHWTKARYWAFTRADSNVSLARQQWPRDVIGCMPVATRNRCYAHGCVVKRSGDRKLQYVCR